MKDFSHVFWMFTESLTTSFTGESCGNFTYQGLQVVFVHTVSNTPLQKSHVHNAHEGTSTRKLTWQISVLQTKSSSKPLWIMKLGCRGRTFSALGSIFWTPTEPPHTEIFCHWILLMVIFLVCRTMFELFSRISMVNKCSPDGISTVLGLHVCSSKPKSVFTRQIRWDKCSVSYCGIISRLYLQGFFHGSHVYFSRCESSFSRK